MDRFEVLPDRNVDRKVAYSQESSSQVLHNTLNENDEPIRGIVDCSDVVTVPATVHIVEEQKTKRISRSAISVNGLEGVSK